MSSEDNSQRPAGACAVPASADKAVQAAEIIDRSVKSSLYRVIRLQSFLLEFDQPDVRKAFLTGEFGVPHNTVEMLTCFKRMREMLLPSPCGTFVDKDVTSQTGVDLFLDLMDGGSDEPLDSDKRPFSIWKSFQWWLNSLGMIRKARYWETAKRCSVPQANGPCDFEGFSQRQSSDLFGHNKNEIFVPLSQSSPLRKQRNPETTELEDQRFRLSDPCTRKSDNPQPSDRYMFRAGKDIGKSRLRSGHVVGGQYRDDAPAWEDEVPFIGATRWQPEAQRKYDYSSDSDSYDSGHSILDERRKSELVGANDELLARLLRELKGPREIVAPIKFNGSDGGSLSRFLGEYEKYFNECYKGTDYQCAQLLGDFLVGSAKQAYKAMDGAAMRYSRLRPLLLDWYRSTKSNQRYIRESEFDHATMAPFETLGIYCLRLERLAAKAYPGSGKEQERHLCQKLWKTAPKDFQRVMSDSERNLALVGDRKRLNWSLIKKLAGAEDRRTKHSVNFQKDSAEVMQATEPEELLAKQQVEAMIAAQNKYYAPKRPTFTRSELTAATPRETAQRPVQARKQTSAPLMCNWCGRRGHLEDRCWEKLGACIICGSTSHVKEQCPKYEAAFSGFKPVCSICSGSHLGRDCTANPLN